MNAFLRCFSVILLCISIVNAQQNSRVVPGFTLSDYESYRWEPKEDFPKYIKLKSTSELDTANVKFWILANYLPYKDCNIRYKGIEKDEIGFEHKKYIFSYQDIEIEGFELIIHSKNQKVISVNGDVSRIKVIHSEIILNEKEAFEKAIKLFKSKNFTWNNPDNQSEIPKALLVYKAMNNKIKEGDFRLTYKFDIYSIDPLKRQYVYIDASTGEVVFTEDRICHIDYTATAQTKYSSAQTIKTSFSGINYILQESGRGNGIQTLNLRNGSNYTAASDFEDSDNNWNNVNSFQDEVATDAHFGAEKTYDFYFSKFGRNSYDNAGAIIKSYVHYGYSYNNAFWDGSRMTYGDGDGSYFTPLVSPDVCGHEITHAVTEKTASLVYSYESGALNESFSDIFGKAVEIFAVPTTTSWLIGNKITPNGLGIRSMDNPNMHGDPDTYLGQYWYTSSGDNGGVHINSGVQNHWFYLLVNGGNGVNDLGNAYTVTGIGIDKASKIAYRNLSVYLTSNSVYSDSRYYSITAAQDLYGACSQEVISTANAWYAVGVGSAPTFEVKALFGSDKTYSCTTPVTIKFANNSFNASSYYWDFGDGTTSTDYSPTKVYNFTGNYTVTLTAQGSASCNSGTDVVSKVNYIIVDNFGSPLSANCTPLTSLSSASIGISRVIINTIDKSTSNSTEGYKDFTCSNNTLLQTGKSYPITIQTNSNFPEKVKTWIDYNNDGVFTSDEILFSDDKIGLHNANFLVPSNSNINIPLRMRVGSGYSGYPAPDGCSSIVYGQYEDYTIKLFNGQPAAPVANFKSISNQVLPGKSITYTDISENFPTSWSWTFEGGSPATSNQKNPTVTYQNEGVYNVSLTTSNIYGSSSENKLKYINVSNAVNMCDSLRIITFNSGKIYDSGGKDGDYKDLDSCRLIVKPTCSSSIVFKFKSFDLETYYDYLKIYNGSTTSAPLLLNSTGATLPDSVIVTSGVALITFYADEIITRKGFELEYYLKANVTPLIANFSISNTNPGLNTEVKFVNTSVGESRNNIWTFGNGLTSNLLNSTAIYTTSGVKTIKLSSSNCKYKDSTTKSILVQNPGSVTISPLVLNNVLAAGDTILRDLTISNSGPGDIYYELLLSNIPYDSTSLKVYSVSGATTRHKFRNINKNVENVKVTITLNGDYDYYSEYASLFINDDFIEDIDDKNVWNGTDIVKNYTFSGTQLKNWLSYGYIEVRLVNSPEVNTNIGGRDEHRVSVNVDGSSSWILPHTITSGIIKNGNNINNAVKISARNLNAGNYTLPLLIKTSDLNYPTVTITSNLTVLGNPFANFIASKTTAPMGSTIDFTDLSLNNPTTWNWTFEGPNLITSSVRNPSINFLLSGSYNVYLKITNAQGTHTTKKTNYIKITPISVSGINPNPTYPSNYINIYGEGLNNINYVYYKNYLGNINTSYFYLSGNNISYYIPNSAITSSLTLTSGMVQITSPVLTVTSTTPNITAITPNPTSVNKNINLNGTGFANVANVSCLNNIGQASYCNFYTVSNGLIVNIPYNAVTGPLTLSGSFGNVISPVVTITVFTPTILGISPNPSSGSGYVNISGAGFGSVNYIYYRTNYGYSSTSNFSDYGNRLQLYLYSDIITGPLTLAGSFGSRITPILTITAITPTVTGIAPNPVSSGNYISIYGAGFNNANSILYRSTYGYTNSTYFSNYGNYLSMNVPSDAMTGILTITGNFGAVSTPVLTITSITPTVTGISPNPVSAGSYVNINGSGFSNVSYIFYRNVNGYIYSTNFSNYGNYLSTYVPSDMVTGAFTLSGAFGIVIAPVLNIIVNPSSFMCSSNLSNNGGFNPGTVSQILTASTGYPNYWTFAGLNQNIYKFSTCNATDDTYLRIYNSSGLLVASNDNYGVACSSLQASLEFVPSNNDIFYLLVSRSYCSNLITSTPITYSYTLNVPPSISSIINNPATPGSYISILGTNLSRFNTIRYRTQYSIPYLNSFSNYDNMILAFLPSDAISSTLTFTGTMGTTVISPYLSVLVPSPSFLCMNYVANNGNLPVINALQSGTLYSGNAYYWTFSGVSNYTYRFSTCGSTTDTYLRVYNNLGTLIASNDNNSPVCSSNAASIDFTPTTTGTYYLLLTQSNCTALTNNTNLSYQISLINGVTPVVALFSSNKTSIKVEEQVTFTGLSTGNPTSFKWTFYGGTPNASTLVNPIVTYNTEGTYNVKLVVKNNLTADSVTKVGYIKVSKDPVTTITDYIMCTVAGTSDNQGKITDSGGNNLNYSNNEKCAFIINSSCSSGMQLKFNYFNTEPFNDYVKIYDGSSNFYGAFAASISGYGVLPAPVYTKSGLVLVTFNSNSSVNYGGFNLEWSCYNVTELPELITNDIIKVYPNPANDHLVIEYVPVVKEIWEINISNFLGETIYSRIIDSETNSQNLETETWASGIYLIKITSGSHSFVRKLIVK
ncbi:MAG: M4 family metallopeptidase [Bacteroidota bacterium]|nr:M4 family metallopeptidase [Bacteroidota bacterium]